MTGGMTALMLAARENSLEVARVLVSGGADLNSTMANGTSALLMAIVNGLFELAAFLLDGGADPNIADRDGKSSLQGWQVIPIRCGRHAQYGYDRYTRTGHRQVRGFVVDKGSFGSRSRSERTANGQATVSSAQSVPG